MARIITDLKNAFDRGDMTLRLIYINVAVFVLVTLVLVFMRLFNADGTALVGYLQLPASLGWFARQPWSLVTYMFLHVDLLHILFNMLWLYWFGRLFLLFFSAKHLRGLYLLGGICGGLLYMLAYNVFPYFENQLPRAVALGASASVLAIVVATACRQPNYSLQLFLFGSLRIKYLAFIMVLTDLMLITSDNAGGHIAHLGGAMAGWAFATCLDKGHDLTAWINRALDAPGKLLRASARKPKMKLHYGGKSARNMDYEYNARKKEQSDEIDRILEKLKKSGYGSLTTEEKKRLFDASKH